MSRQGYEVRDESDLKHYFTQTPNIIFELGLTPYELTLYLHLKRTVGGGTAGVCWKNTRTLAQETGMSAGSVSNAKDALQKPREMLGGKSLITVESGRVANSSDRITIEDIWPENMAYFAPKRAAKQQDRRSPDEHQRSRGEHQCSSHERQRSPRELKKIEAKKNSFEEEPAEEAERGRARAKASAAAAPPSERIISPEPESNALIEAIVQVAGLPPLAQLSRRQQAQLPAAAAFVLDQVGGDIEEGARQVLARFSAPIWSLPNPVALSQFRAAEWCRQGAKAQNIAAQHSGAALVPQTANERKLAADADYTRRRRAQAAEILGGIQ